MAYPAKAYMRPALTCPKTGKYGYSTRKAAKTTNRRLGHHLKVYRCDHCGYWHLGHDFGLPRAWHRARRDDQE